jgi:hypothetical protein
MKCPADIYQRSARAYPGTPEDIAYPDMYGRRVDKHGKVDWHGAEITISGSLRGWSVGLNPTAEGKVEVWFGRLLLGSIDRATEAGQLTDKKVT